MKAIILLLTTFMFFFQSHAQLFTFSFNGAATCPTLGSSLLSQPANVTVSAVTRVGTISCSPSNSVFSTYGWSTTSSVDLTQYIEVIVTAATGYTLTASTINFSVANSSTGPQSGRVGHDGGTGSITETYDFSIGGNTNNISWTFTTFSTVSGGAAKFRIYSWGAPNINGTLRLDDLSLSAYVTAVSPINIDYPNGRVGIGTTPDANARLNVDGNIFTNGKIAILTNDPLKIANYALAVNGDAIFNKVKVKLYANWADYVFSNDYKLSTLEEVEKFIKLNKHLPEVPSTNEVKVNGIDLEETQTILLKKIEELTLYIIDINKKVESISKENQVIRTEIDNLKNERN
jgi:hypothetical protein